MSLQPTKSLEGKKSSLLPIVIGVIFLAAIAAITWFFLIPKLKGKKTTASEKRSPYSAVFLTGGQVYFGKIKSETSTYVILENVFFLSKKPKPKKSEATVSAEPNYSITPLKSDPLGPIDEIKINRQNIATIQPLAESSLVVQRIKTYLKVRESSGNP